MKTLILLLGLFFFSQTHAADLKALTQMYREGFSSFYQPRFCGNNVLRFLQEANRRSIDISDVIVVRLEGGGFWETRGFSVRGREGGDEMLGYFHVFFVANGYAFDFDFTSQPKVLPLSDYLVGMYAPPTAYYRSPLRGNIQFLDEFVNWQVTLWAAKDYIGSERVTRFLAKKKMSQWIERATLSQALERKYRVY